MIYMYICYQFPLYSPIIFPYIIPGELSILGVKKSSEDLWKHIFFLPFFHLLFPSSSLPLLLTLEWIRLQRKLFNSKTRIFNKNICWLNRKSDFLFSQSFTIHMTKLGDSREDGIMDEKDEAHFGFKIWSKQAITFRTPISNVVTLKRLEYTDKIFFFILWA